MIVSQKIQTGNKQPQGEPWTNQIFDWYGSDCQESFQRMMQNPQHRDYFQSLNWDKLGTITYKFNNLGFRGDDPNWNKPTLMTFGCSYTMGIGLPQDKVWPWAVGAALNLQTVNFALGGASADWCFRMAEYWIPSVRPQAVVMLAPPPARLELVTDSGPIWYSAQETVQDVFLQSWFVNNENQRLNSIKNRLAIIALCQQHCVPCLTYDAHQWFAKSREEVGYARDYMHAGIPGHQELSTQIIKDYNEITIS